MTAWRVMRGFDGRLLTVFAQRAPDQVPDNDGDANAESHR
jgi:hypothetical protein